jgi:hypothetical protein
VATVRLVNPTNQTTLTREQVAQRQAKHVEFTRNVGKDAGLADKLAGLSVEEYAQRKGFRLKNPTNEKETKEMTDQKLVQKIDELCETNRELTQVVRRSQGASSDGRRSNPGASSEGWRSNPGHRLTNPNGDEGTEPSSLRAASAERRAKRVSSHLDEALDAMEDVQAALDEGDPEAAQEILQEVLGEYDSEGDRSDED